MKKFINLKVDIFKQFGNFLLTSWVLQRKELLSVNWPFKAPEFFVYEYFDINI